MKRRVVLTSSLLVACALEVPGSGPSLTHDGPDAVHVEDPIQDGPGAPPGSGLRPSTTPNAPSTSNASAAPVNVAAAGADASAGSVSVDAGAQPVAPLSDAGALTPAGKPIDPGKSGGFKLASTAFDDGARLSAPFTCADVSPPLHWENAPPETKAFALVLTSKTAAKSSASPSVEWVVWGIPAARMNLPQGVAAGAQPSNVPGARQDSREEDDATGFTGGGFGSPAGTGFTGGFGTIAGTGFTGGSFGTVAGAGFTGGNFGAVAGASFGGGWGGGVSVPGAGVPTYPTDSGTPPRYHGPCGSAQTSLEFTLFALDAAQAAQWGSFVTVDTVAQWLKTGGQVLGHASLSASFP